MGDSHFFLFGRSSTFHTSNKNTLRLVKIRAGMFIYSNLLYDITKILFATRSLQASATPLPPNSPQSQPMIKRAINFFSIQNSSQRNGNPRTFKQFDLPQGFARSRGPSSAWRMKSQLHL